MRALGSAGDHIILTAERRMVPFKDGLVVKPSSFKHTMRRQANESALNLFELEIDECQARGPLHVLKIFTPSLPTRPGCP